MLSAALISKATTMIPAIIVIAPKIIPAIAIPFGPPFFFAKINPGIPSPKLTNPSV